MIFVEEEAVFCVNPETLSDKVPSYAIIMVAVVFFSDDDAWHQSSSRTFSFHKPDDWPRWIERFDPVLFSVRTIQYRCSNEHSALLYGSVR